MLADFVVLSDDIFVIEPGRIREASVLYTVTDGKVVYEKK
jgi:predicted amidohydrolase YtcJ